MEFPYCDEVPYWKTSRTSPDGWIQKTVQLLQRLGATNISEMFGASCGRAAFVLAFSFGVDNFRVVWPVLPPRKAEDAQSARVQAATLLYHDCKAKAVAASVLGPRNAFIGALLLPDDRTVIESSLPTLTAHLSDTKRLCGPVVEVESISKGM